MEETPILAEDLLRSAGARRLAEGPGAYKGVSIDSRTVGGGELFVAIRGPRFDGHDFLRAAWERGARAAVVDRETPAPPGMGLFLVADATEALGALARDRRVRLQTPVVAITGSTGKTTTKEMTAALLADLGPVLKTEGNLNNTYGLPLTLLRLDGSHRAAVVELGMSAPGEIRSLASIARPNVAVITNVAPVHLAFFPSVDAIAAAKAEILEGLETSGVAVLNGDDPRLRALGERHTGRVLFFGRDRSFEVSADAWRGTAFGMRFLLRIAGQSYDVALPLAGPHFMMNFLAAAAAARHLGVLPEAIVERAAQIRPVAHRGEVVPLAQGVTLLDDSYNASPLAVEAAAVALALVGQRRRRVAFLGDMLELGESAATLHRETGEHIAGKLEVLVGVGELARGFLEGASRAGLAPSSLLDFPSATEAAHALPQIVRPGDSVLVKGSRGMRMETIVEALKAAFPSMDGPGTDKDAH
jgi:UDP-N-acetylmuramoyl-tripeptide--D-alanyl-D-alanine ligase